MGIYFPETTTFIGQLNIMSQLRSIRPEDILADGVDTVESRGVMVRKGTVAAFMANIAVLEGESSEEEQGKALAIMKELAPSIIAMGLNDFVVFKNPQAAKVIYEASKEVIQLNDLCKGGSVKIF